MVFKQSLSGGDVAFVDVNSDDVGLFKGVNDALQGLTSGGSDVQYILSRWVIQLCNSAVGGSG